MRRTLIDVLERDIAACHDVAQDGPNWLIELEVACARHTMARMPAAEEPLVAARVKRCDDSAETHPAEAAQQR